MIDVMTAMGGTATVEVRGAAPPVAGPHRFATGPVTAIAALVALGHLVAATLTSGYWLDEAYMLAIGRSHLAWGSADQPPLVPALAWLADTVAPGSLLALRLPVIAATTAAVVVAALIARELGGDRRAQVLTAAAQATGLFAALSGHWLTPYALEPLEWLVGFWLLVRWIRVRDDRLLLALGLVLGIALLTKVQVAALCVALLVAVAVLGPRALLGRPLLWAGGALALVIAAPTLVWQARHGWPQLGMTPVVAREVELIYGGRPALAWELIGFGGLLGTGLALAGLWWLVRDPAWRDHRFLGAAFVALYGVFLVTEARPYYLLGYVGVLAAVGAVGFQLRGRRRAWPAWVAGSVSAVLAVAVLAVSPSLGPTTPGRDAAAVAARVPDRPRPGSHRPRRAGLRHRGLARRLLGRRRTAARAQHEPGLRLLRAAAGGRHRRAVRRRRPARARAVLPRRPAAVRVGGRSHVAAHRADAAWAGFWPGLRHLGIV